MSRSVSSALQIPQYAGFPSALGPGSSLAAKDELVAETLLRLLFHHVAGGLSLEQTALRAAQLDLADISAVALFKRLRAARSWLEGLCAQLIAEHTLQSPGAWPLQGRTCRVLDASDILEPGATGSSWRLHYNITLPGL